MDIVLNVDAKDLDLNETVGGYRDEDGDYVRGGTVAEAVVSKLVTLATRGGDYSDNLKQRVQKIRDEEIRSQIAATVAAALNEPLQMTNSYGQPSGATTTLTELIVKNTERWLSETDRDRQSGRDVRRVDNIVRAHVEAAFKAEIADAVKAAREAVSVQLGKSLSDVVTEAVRQGLTTR